MRFRAFHVPLLLLAVALGGAARTEPPKPAPIPTEIPSGQRWLTHFQDDLLPFWNLPDAWGSPRGDFPTFRCNDGRLPAASNPCPEIADAPGWIKVNAGRDFVRMKSRQTFFYGVAYHLTGDPAMLALARDGATFLRQRALDRATGSAISYWEKGVAGPPVLERTSQDLAYAQLGLAMYYYLTRDEGVLADILRLKEHIFRDYWSPEWGMLRWTVKGPEADRQELVAQLDQINAYMLLLAPILPEPHRSRWQADLQTLARVMREKFFAPKEHLFWGTLHDPSSRTLDSRHTDFGHTAKALWMLERIGRLTGDAELRDFATREAKQVLRRAYLPQSGSWASRPHRDGSLDSHKEWWIYAELDQTAATLALSDHSQAAVLPRTYDYWLRYLVDHRQHEVFGWVNGETNEGGDGPKIHQWKSGYHSGEHALVSCLTSQALRGEPAALYFAFADPKAVARPYLFSGREGGRETTPLPGFPGRQRVRVTFTALQ